MQNDREERHKSTVNSTRSFTSHLKKTHDSEGGPSIEKQIFSSTENSYSYAKKLYILFYSHRFAAYKPLCVFF